MIDSMVAFVKACRSKNSGQIYAIFEDQTHPDLRDLILELYSGDQDPEPVRSALNALGRKARCKALIAY